MPQEAPLQQQDHNPLVRDTFKFNKHQNTEWNATNIIFMVLLFQNCVIYTLLVDCFNSFDALIYESIRSRNLNLYNKIRCSAEKGKRSRIIQIGAIENDEFSERPNRNGGTNRISNSEIGNLGANGVNDSGEIGAWNKWHRELLLVLPQYLQVIRKIHAGRFDSHSYGGGRIQLRDRVMFRDNYGARIVLCRHCWITQFSTQ